MSDYTKVTSPQVYTKHPDAIRTLPAIFSRELATGETLSGSPTASASPSGLTVDNVSVESSAFTTEEGESIPANEAVKFRVSGGTADTDYLVLVKCGTTIAGELLAMQCRVQVRDQ